MNNTLVLTLLIALAIIYFVFLIWKGFKKTKELKSFGDYLEVRNLTPSFYIFIAVYAVLICYLLYSFKDVDIIQKILAALIIVFLIVTNLINTKILLSAKGVLYMNRFNPYKEITGVSLVENPKNGKFTFQFIKNNKAVLVFKTDASRKDEICEFLKKNRVKVIK